MAIREKKLPDDKRTVIDGPFAETKKLIAGFWLWQVNSKEEAIEWVKRCLNPMPDCFNYTHPLTGQNPGRFAPL